MSAATDALEDALLDHLLNHIPLASPGQVYLAASTTPIGDDGVMSEPAGGGYARVACGGIWAKTGGGSGEAKNLAAIVFPEATATWGQVVAVAVVDAASGGTVLLKADLDEPIWVLSPNSLLFEAGDIAFTVNFGASDYLEDALLDHVLNGVEFASPTNVWLGLATGSVADDGTFPEPSGGGYTRVDVTTRFGIAGGGPGLASNSSPIYFPEATAAWGIALGHFGIFDSESGGNFLAWGPLDSPIGVVSGNRVRFATGELEVTVA